MSVDYTELHHFKTAYLANISADLSVGLSGPELSGTFFLPSILKSTDCSVGTLLDSTGEPKGRSVILVRLELPFGVAIGRLFVIN